MQLSSQSYFATTNFSSIEPTMGFSPFVFEKDLNIEFRKALEGQHHAEDQMTDMDTALSPSHHEHCAAGLDVDHVTSPPLEVDINIPATPTSETSPVSGPWSSILPTRNTPLMSNSSVSAASTDGTSTWSDVSSSPASGSSPTSVTTSIGISTSSPSSSVSQTSPSSASSSPPSSPSTHPCPLCDLVFRTGGQLTKHWYLKHEKRFSCLEPECNAAFHLKADLSRHTTSKHSDEQGKMRIGCLIMGCKKTFTRRDNMRRHMREEHEAGGRRRAG